MSKNETIVTMELMFETLKAIRASQERMEGDIKDLKYRVGVIERDIGGLHERISHFGTRFDTLESRLSRIEKRLDLVDA